MGGLLQPVVLRAVQPLGNVRLRRCFGATVLCWAGCPGVVISLPLVRGGGLVSVDGQV